MLLAETNIGSKFEFNFILTSICFISISHRLDENLHVDDSEKRYPQKLSTSNWKKVKNIKIDTALQKDGITYFFSGKMFYRFNDGTMTLETDKPRVSSAYWMDCQYTEEELSTIQKSARIQNDEELETSSALPTTPATTVSVFILFFHVCKLFV